jgi:hypothetical protein
MPNTYTELRKTTVGTATSSVTLDLTGISGYTDLVLVAFVRNTSGSATDESLNLEVNGDSGSNYSFTQLYGNGSTASSNRVSNTTVYSSAGRVSGGGTTAGTFGANIIQLQNYSNTTTNKTFLTRGNTAESYALTSVGLWRSTAAITSIKLSSGGGFNLAVGSTFSLYGIANADLGAAKATGGIITEDSQYWYHTFGASGAFIPKQSLSCDVLVVAGGGGAGGGGAGAGGVFYATSQSLTAISHSITVGGGGNAGSGTSSGGTSGTVGVNSTFGALTSAIGGAYSTGTDGAGVNGGSGSGASPSSTGARSGGTSTQTGTGGTGYGNSGGANVYTASPYPSGGGGGAGSAGSSSTGSSTAGNGGAGLNTWSSWVTTAGIATNGYIAGGGGGSVYGAGTAGTGGIGGGGAGGANGTAGQNGTIYTGSGGGGGGNAAGGKGGSGVVIVRYAK